MIRHLHLDDADYDRCVLLFDRADTTTTGTKLGTSAAETAIHGCPNPITQVPRSQIMPSRRLGNHRTRSDRSLASLIACDCPLAPLFAWAKRLGRQDYLALLQQNLDEEKATDKKLTAMAEAKVNRKAA